MALLFDVADKIATITFNRSEAMNAMDPDTYRELSEAWIEVRDNPDIWVAVITGAATPERPPEKQSFTSGADLKKTIPQTPELWEFWQNPLAVRAIKELAVRSQYMHIQDGLRLEGAIQSVLRQSEDSKEGPRAFAEKRPAVYKGR